ncbi:MAG: hypothetical protein AAF702_29020 [Chloroflexota bacterium]
MSEHNVERKKHLRLWISDDWYIPINEKGQSVGICNEGALGFVIQLWSTSNDESRMALKIPKLMAETHRENAYVSELMTQELETVRVIFHGQGNRRGLLQAHDASDLLQGPISIKSIREAQEWDNAHIMVRYEKSQNPYFCLVKWENDKLHKFPEGADCPEMDEATFERLKDKAYDATIHERDWSKTVFIELSESQTADTIEQGIETSQRKEPLRVLNVAEALETNEIGRTWFTCLPSVMYPWAPNTLQETISLGYRDDSWSVRQHLQLIEQVCTGLDVLHSRGLIHADVRPANIVYQGNVQEPQSYVVSDYGSLATAGVVSAQHAPVLTGATVIGPVVQGERSSFFYAPERGLSRERENADTAIIVDPGGGGSLYIVLGWKTDLIQSDLLDMNGKPVPEPEQYVKFINTLVEDNEEESVNTRLHEGDRIQIRDYIFELVDTERHGHNLQTFECKKEHWVVYHGRIVVRCEQNEFESCHSFPISRTIELLQWSASTDLYSLGVLALYSVYCHGLQDVRNSAGPIDSESEVEVEALDSNDEIIPDDERLIDERFLEMLTYLANKSHFNAIWRRLEWLRKQLEEGLSQDHTGEYFANLPFERHRVLDSEKKQRTLKEEAEAVVSRITQTVPGTEDLLRVLDYNLGSFVFYLHFVLRCLHRIDDLEVQEEWMSAPFCQNRHESPTAGAAEHALNRVGEIQDILQKPALKALHIEPKSIPGFDLRPETEIRADVHALRDREKDLTKQLQGLQKQEEQLNEEVNSLQQSKQEASRSIEQLQGELEHIRSAKQELDSEWASVNEYIGHALNLMENATRYNPFDVIRIFQEVQDNFWRAYRPSTPTRAEREPIVTYELPTTT